MAANELPCIGLLESTPVMLRCLMDELSDEDVRWKPADDRFSIAEVLAHLSHSEGHCYRARLDRILGEERPEIEADDARSHLELYRTADPEDSFDHFEEQRETNVEDLRELPAEAGARVAYHREAGEITLDQMLHEWALHDLGHVRQVAELVRARKYLAGAGPLGRYYEFKTMTIRQILPALWLAGSLAAQTFIHMSDPQFGMYAKDQSFGHETVNFEFAIATANRLKPAFVVITGDLINKGGDAAQTAEYKRITAKLNPAIHLYSVPGNHDVGNEPTPQSLATYRERFGRDYYSFREGAIYGIVLNSSLLKSPKNVADEAARMEAWLQNELETARGSGLRHILVFQHIPAFLKDPAEPETYDSFSRETRARYLKLLHDYGVKQVFCGHYHANAGGMNGDLEMIVSGPVGMPLRGGKSGLRIATVADDGVKHRYYDFGELPETLIPQGAAPAASKK